MSEPRRGSRIHRILFALNAAERGALACAAAVRLAAELRVELHGLFIEDLDLLRASALPFAKEISLSGCTLRPITFESMELSLHAIAEQRRTEVAERAREANIACSFDVRRESLPRALLQAVGRTDLLVIGPREMALNLRRVAPSKLRPWGATGPLIVLSDGHASAERTVEAAIEIQRAFSGQITLHVVSDDPGKMAQLLTQATAFANSSRSGAAVEAIGVTTIQDVLELARRQRASLVLTGAANPLVTEQGLRLLIERIECPIGVVS